MSNLDPRYNDAATLDAMSKLIELDPEKGRYAIEIINYGFFQDHEILPLIETLTKRAKETK